MSRFDELKSLEFSSLARILASGDLERSELEPSQWLGMVSLLTMRFTERIGRLSVEDARIGSTAVSRALEAAVQSAAIDETDSVARKLNLGAALLRRVAPCPDVDLLNPGYLVELMLGELPLSLGEARRLAKDWRSRDIADIRQLRTVKNLVSPVAALQDAVPDGPSREKLAGWLTLCPSLP